MASAGRGVARVGEVMADVMTGSISLRLLSMGVGIGKRRNQAETAMSKSDG